MTQNNNFRVAKIEPAHPTWFFERPDGEIFAAEENEAWELLKHGNSGWRMRGIKLIGHSDGTVYRAAMVEASKIVKEKHECDGEYCGICLDHEAKVRETILNGFNAELERARGNLSMPGNKDILFREGTSADDQRAARQSLGL
jgi:hypothetical protein